MFSRQKTMNATKETWRGPLKVSLEPFGMYVLTPKHHDFVVFKDEQSLAGKRYFFLSRRWVRGATKGHGGAN